MKTVKMTAWTCIAVLFAACLLCGPLRSSVFATDVSVTVANCLPSPAASFAVGIAGETITQCQVVCLDTTTNTVLKADANGTCKTVYGLAATASLAGQKITVVTRDPSMGAGFVPTPGAVYVSSQTAGGIAPVSDNLPTATPGAPGVYTTVLGIGKTATTITFDPLSAGVAIP